MTSLDAIPRKAVASFRIGGPIAIALAAVVMLIVTWRKWPDVLIDFGQQLYLAWQMTEGRVLYADLVCNYGPLAPYANAWAFSIFGPSMMTLAALNLAVFTGIVVVTYRLLRRVASPISATIGGMILVLVFAFSQLQMLGNFNYATPYENSLTIGLLPALLAVWLALRYRDHGRMLELGLVGVCLGLSFLTKPEVFLAGFSSVIAGLAGTAWTERWSTRRVATAVSVIATGSTIVILTSVVLLATAMPWPTAISGTLGSWSALFGSTTGDLQFYRSGMGTINVPYFAGRLAVTAGWWACAALAALAIGWIPVPRRGWNWSVALVGAVVAAVTVGTLVKLDDWLRAARPLQCAMAIAAVFATIGILRRRNGEKAHDGTDHVARLAFAAFALALLLKMILNVRIYHYGFVLAMPATLLTVVAMIEWIPRWVERRGRNGLATAGAAFGLLVAFTVAHLRLSNSELSIKHVEVGTGADRFYADDRGILANRALELIRGLKAETVAVFPEGSMLNFLTRCPNPTPNYNYMPTGFSIFGEEAILAPLRQTPPDVVVLVEKDTSEFGFRYFGTDYAKETMAFLRANYSLYRVLNKQPFTGQGFGIAVLRRRK